MEKYESLIDLLNSDNRKLIMLAPSDFEWESADDQYLHIYTEAIASLASKKGIPFIKGNFVKQLGVEPPMDLVLSVKEKSQE